MAKQKDYTSKMAGDGGALLKFVNELKEYYRMASPMWYPTGGVVFDTKVSKFVGGVKLDYESTGAGNYLTLKVFVNNVLANTLLATSVASTNHLYIPFLTEETNATIKLECSNVAVGTNPDDSVRCRLVGWAEE